MRPGTTTTFFKVVGTPPNLEGGSCSSIDVAIVAAKVICSWLVTARLSSALHCQIFSLYTCAAVPTSGAQALARLDDLPLSVPHSTASINN